MSGIHLITGLANPGKDYALTRHNAGAWFIERLLAISDTALKTESKLHGLHVQARLEGKACHLLVPTTFMNRSGQAVNAASHYFKIEPEHILIAHDDLDLPVGTVKLKLGGGDGGHNGLKDIIAHLGTKNFYRLRIGIGRPNKDVIDYVLKAPGKAERAAIDDAIEQTLSILPLLMKGEMQKAMQQLHTTE